MLVLPLLNIDFRLGRSAIVSCSDASLQGAGAVISRSLTPEGTEQLLRRMAPLAELGDDYWVLVESFAEIGGARRAAELLGLRPRAYVAIEVDPEAVTLLEYHYPEGHVLGDIREVTVDHFLKVASKTPRARLVVHVGGSPCPGLCRWNPFADATRDLSEELLGEFRRVTLCLEEAWPHTEVKEVEENVKSMSLDHCDDISAYLDKRPMAIDSGDLLPRRRQRYFWADWALSSRHGVEVERREHYDKVKLTVDAEVPSSVWCSPGWEPCAEFRTLPTLTKPVPVREPRWHTPGEPGSPKPASDFAIRHWKKDWHRP